MFPRQPVRALEDGSGPPSTTRHDVPSQPRFLTTKSPGHHKALPREGLRRDTSARNVPRHFQDKVKIPQELEREQVLWCLGALVVNCNVRAQPTIPHAGVQRTKPGPHLHTLCRPGERLIRLDRPHYGRRLKVRIDITTLKMPSPEDTTCRRGRELPFSVPGASCRRSHSREMCSTRRACSI